MMLASRPPTPVQAPDAALAEYAELKARVRETLLLGQQRIEAARVLTYWQTGWAIRTHLALQERRTARYGQQVVERLSRELAVHESVLRRCVQFAEQLPELFSPEEIRATWRESPQPAGAKADLKPGLTWSHYRALLTVPTAAQRQALLRDATRHAWPVATLEARVRHITAKADPRPASSPNLLTPRRGTPGLFCLKALAGTLYWDLGFESYRALTPADARRFAAGSLVRLTADGALVPAPDAQPADLYGYAARVLRVVDGDTLWLLIHLGGEDWRKEKLRLRGVNCPELRTPAGASAKRFVEALVQRATRLVITTTKPDQWDRYLSDVFLTMPDGEEIFLNNRLLETAHARRYEAVSPKDWE